MGISRKRVARRSKVWNAQSSAGNRAAAARLTRRACRTQSGGARASVPRGAPSEVAAGYSRSNRYGAGARGNAGARVEERFGVDGRKRAGVNTLRAAPAHTLDASTRGETIIRGRTRREAATSRTDVLAHRARAVEVNHNSTNLRLRTPSTWRRTYLRVTSTIARRIHRRAHAREITALRATTIARLEDAGSGALLDLGAYNLQDEPVIRESVAGGADIVSFSGDKLLGATQAGLIVGRRDLVERCRKNSLYRALRADKLALAALAATLDSHARGAAFTEVPAMRMLAASYAEIGKTRPRFLRRARGRASRRTRSSSKSSRGNRHRRRFRSHHTPAGPPHRHHTRALFSHRARSQKLRQAHLPSLARISMNASCSTYARSPAKKSQSCSKHSPRSKKRTTNSPRLLTGEKNCLPQSAPPSHTECWPVRARRSLF